MLKIFSFLKHRELGKVAQVCRKWRLLAYDSRLWTVVSLRPEQSTPGCTCTARRPSSPSSACASGPPSSTSSCPPSLSPPPCCTSWPQVPGPKIYHLGLLQRHAAARLQRPQQLPLQPESMCICLSEVIFLEGFMRRIYSCPFVHRGAAPHR